jgi:pyridoxal/pyridoxine/pyridoxamine kinase
MVVDIMDAILKLYILKDVSTIVTGYIGFAEIVKRAGFIQTIKYICPKIQYICDPVMGDI